MLWHLARAFGLLVCCFVALASSGGINAQKANIGVVDVHTHLVPGPRLSFERSVAAAVELMDRYGIATSILMSPPRMAGIRQNYDVGNFRAALAKYPGRFVFLGGGGTLNPMLHSHADVSTITAEG